MTPRLKTVLEAASREAESQGHTHTDTEHILLALIDHVDGVVARIMLEFDTDAVTIRSRVLDVPVAALDDPATSDLVRAFADAVSAVATVKDLAIEAQDFELAAAIRDVDLILRKHLHRLRQSTQRIPPDDRP